MGLFKKSAPSVDTTKVDTLIGSEAFFQGVLSVKGSLRIDGRIEGAVTGAQSVIVGAAGLVRGDITADFVVVGGKVQGDVSASEMIEVLSQGQVAGDISTPRLLVEEGALLDGSCQMTSRAPQRSAAPSSDGARPAAREAAAR